MNRQDISYTCCTSHKTLKNINMWEKEKSRHMDKSDDARENSIRSGFLSTDTEAYTHRREYSLASRERRITHEMMPF